MKNDWIKGNFIKKIKYREVLYKVLYKNRRKVEDEGNTLAILRIFLFLVRDQAGIYVSYRTLPSSLLSNSKNYHQRTRKINANSKG